VKLPYMPLFQGDLLAKTLHLSTQEFGAYMLLILHAWTHRAEVMVKDAQRISRVGNRHWAEVRDTLAPFFDPPDGLLGRALKVVHPRVAEELAKAGEISNKRKGAALQMHEIRRANAVQVHMHPSSPSLEFSNGKEGEAQPMQMHSFRDKGPDYRAAPSGKSDNVLQPFPEKRTVKEAR
jgi:uncharacterized protein YdaU (DUF1376 family)